MLPFIGPLNATHDDVELNLHLPFAIAPPSKRLPMEWATMIVLSIVLVDALLVELIEIAMSHTFCC
jgi:hypothetical protein